MQLYFRLCRRDRNRCRAMILALRGERGPDRPPYASAERGRGRVDLVVVRMHHVGTEGAFTTKRCSKAAARGAAPCAL
jgi:hypothetical protein